jgi:succinate dehydrogenase/fumarate reductase iron-sulfur protein
MKEAEDIAEVKVLRYNPATEAKPNYRTYQVPLVEGMSISKVLRYIFENLDSDLAFYHSCGRGVCGGCTMMVNSKPVLPCITLADKNMVIEPLPGYKIVRDLVVSFEKRAHK